MSEKLDVVAYAIADALGEGEFYLSPGFQKAAIAAVMAMREPTEEMFNGRYGVEARRQFTDMIGEFLR